MSITLEDPYTEFPTFAAPLITPSTKSPSDSCSFIFLHGRGDTSLNFSVIFYAAPTSSLLCLSELLTPTTRLISPTCLPTRSPTYNTHWPQWFDIYHERAEHLKGGVKGPQAYSVHQMDTLKECVQYIHRVIEVEIERGVPEERIWVGGLSQGMGAAMAAVMTGRWKLGGAIGMSGWLPFAGMVLKRAEQAAGVTETTGGEGAGNPAAAFVEDDNDESPIYHLSPDTRIELLRDLRRNIGLPELNGEGAEDEAIRKVLAIPVWLGHGDIDMTVRYRVGRGVHKALKVLGMSVEWNRYEGLGHWYRCPDEIDDMVSFMVRGGLQLGHDEKVRAAFART